MKKTLPLIAAMLAAATTAFADTLHVTPAFAGIPGRRLAREPCGRPAASWGGEFKASMELP